jgi:hypothetical protein
MVCSAEDFVISKLMNRIPDLELPSAHPRRAFIRKVVDSEVRLAYHDRILQTLPEPMQAKEAEVIGEDPQPNWPYERAGLSLPIHDLIAADDQIIHFFKKPLAYWTYFAKRAPTPKLNPTSSLYQTPHPVQTNQSHQMSESWPSKPSSNSVPDHSPIS